jgi:diadenylate cyclase
MVDYTSYFTRFFYLPNIIDILLVSLLVFSLLVLFRDTPAIRLMRGMLVIFLGVTIINQIVSLTAFTWILRGGAAVLLVAIPVIFQPELREVVQRLGGQGRGRYPTNHWC